MNYSDPFGIQQSTPLSRTLRRIELRQNMQLNWPEGYYGPDYIASINEIVSTQQNLALIMPSAIAANEGTGMLVVNSGPHRIVIQNAMYTQITDLEPGQTKYLYCIDNTTKGGEWRVTSFGNTTSTADAVALAGPGTAVVAGRIAAAYPVSVTANSTTIEGTDRAKLFVVNAGSATLTLPPYTIGNDFFIGVKNGGSGSVTVVAPAGTIDGYEELVLAPNESAWVCCSGTPAWHTVGFGRSTEFQFTKLVKDISAGGVITLTSAEASNKLMQFIGAPAENVIVIVPSVVGIYYVQDSFSGPFTLTMKTSEGSGVALSPTDRAILYCDGVNVTSAQSAAVGTNVSVIDGSLTTPSINFSADPNTGIYRADVDTFGIASDGKNAAQFKFDKSSIAGKLGVGTADPVAWLHVRSGAAEALRIQGTAAWLSWWNTAGEKRFAFTQIEELTANSITYPLLRDNVEDANGQRAFAINGVNRLVITKDGVSINGVLSSTTGQSFASLASNTFTGVQQIPAERFKYISLGALTAGTRNLDLAAAATYGATLTGVVNFTFSNAPPAGYDQTTYLKLINGANYPPVWPNGTKHPKGIKPVLSAGMDLLAIWFDPDLQAHVVGLVWGDYK